MTIREAKLRGAAALGAGRIESAALDAALLLAEVLNTGATGLIVRGEEPLSGADLSRYERLLERRLAGECIAYILGRKEFYGLEFRVTDRVLVPRADTEILAETALQEIRHIMDAGMDASEGPLVLDLCTGSGVLAITLKHECPTAVVWASDISGAAVAVAARNAERLLPPWGIHFAEGSLFEPFRNPSAGRPRRFNVIVSNPPYIPSAEIEHLAPEVRREPRLALDGGRDGLELIEKIIADAGEHLLPEGRILLEADPRQMYNITEILRNNGFENIEVFRDLAGQERVIGGTAPFSVKT
ncbi:MAG: peptide chain release factor N(5)-glutamine methyltransferase [Treponema sp.]|jgi:release factor glutamine methyltransferase|nr:peptide chain release factor N(5)-glutamine methyltransferase [Treponema sp.]